MVKSMLKNGTSILFQTQKTIISAATVLSITYAASAFLSFLRTRILSNYFGDSPELGVFFTADRIPSFIFNVLVVGTLSTVFIPVFTSHLKKSEGDAWRISSAVTNMFILAFGLFGIIAFIFAKDLMVVLSLGKLTAAEVDLGKNLMRIMIGAQVVLIFSSLLTSILQSFRYFLVPSLAPILYNVGMILGVIVLTPLLGIYGAAYGVMIGSLLHLLVQLPLLSRVNYKYAFTLGFKQEGIREIFKLLPPRLLASSVNQISVVVDTSLAIAVSVSSVVVFKFAEQLQSFPVNLFGVSIALAALPTLSYVSDDKDFKKFKDTFNTSLMQMLFLVLPASIMLLVLKVPLVRLVYGAPEFSWPATVATSYTLAFFALSIFTQSAVFLLTRAFYALHDTKTPLLVVICSIAVDILLSVIFVKGFGFGVWSIAFSYTLSSFMDFGVLMYLLSRKVGGFDFDSLVEPFLKISYSAIFMGISLYAPMKILEDLIFDTTRTVPLAMLTMTASIFGFISYFIFTKIFAVKEVELLYTLLAKIRLRTGIAAATKAQVAGKDENVDRSFEV